MKHKHYCVTGGTGFIGTGIVKRLCADGHSVTVLDNNWRGNIHRLSDISDKFDFKEVDIRDKEAVIRATKNTDSIIHLAYINGTENFYSKPFHVLDVAVTGMMNVLAACEYWDIKELILASSSEVYQTPPMVPTSEEVPLVIPDLFNARYSYGGGKIACELLAVNFARKYLNNLIIFRPHNIYGPDMGFEHVIPQLTTKLVKNLDGFKEDNEFKIFGSGAQTRSFCHINDFTNAIMVLLQNKEATGVYHVGNPEEITIMELTKKIAAILEVNPTIVTSEAPIGETSRRVPDIAKLNLLGFAPEISLDEGLPETVQWYKNRISKQGNN